MLEKSMLDQLNRQLNLECYSSHLYLQMSGWCRDNGFSGTTRFLQQQAREEQVHIEKLFNYINETGAVPIIGTITAPPYEFSTLFELFQQIYEHEQSTSESINSVAHDALNIQDYSTFYFLQWYIAKQHQEESLFKDLLDKLELIEDEGKALYLFDQEIKQLVN